MQGMIPDTADTVAFACYVASAVRMRSRIALRDTGTPLAIMAC